MLLKSSCNRRTSQPHTKGIFFYVSVIWSIVGPLLMALQESVSVSVVQLPTVFTITTLGFQLIRTSCGLHLGLNFCMPSAWGCPSMRESQKHTISFPLGRNVASPQQVKGWNVPLLRNTGGPETPVLPLKLVQRNIRFGAFQHKCFPQQAKQPWHGAGPCKCSGYWLMGWAWSIAMDTQGAAWKGSPCSHCVSTSQTWDTGQVSMGPPWIFHPHLTQNKPII